MAHTLPRLVLAALAALAIVAAAHAHAQTPDSGDRERDREPVNLETPQACVENFILAAREGDFGRAAESLNFRLLPDANPADAAERFYFVVNQELFIDWAQIPDRPDGIDDTSPIGQNSSSLPGERTSIHLGSIAMDGREIPIRLERLNRGGQRVWLFAAHTVDNIPGLYDAHGPSWIQQRMPGWAKQEPIAGIALWKLILAALTLVIAPMIAMLLTRAIKAGLERVPVLTDDLLDKFNWPIVAVLTTFGYWVVVELFLALPGTVASFVGPAVLILFVGACTWLAMKIVDEFVSQVGTEAIHRYHDQGTETERRVLTQITVARHAVLLIVAVVGIGVVLLQLDLARTLGVTLLSSAGAAAVILGIAGHAVLGNLIAGLQIAITQPIKLGDTLMIEGNWGTVEDIRYTYVVVNTWDERRLVFPIRHFTTEWFENWSIEDTYLTKPIYLYVDYTAPVEKIREKYEELVRGDELFVDDRDDPELLVTEAGDETLKLRMICPGATASDAWTLECRVREKLVAWLQELDGGAHLPRRRVTLRDHDADDGRGGGGREGRGDGPDENKTRDGGGE